jgi:hypothetical protein
MCLCFALNVYTLKAGMGRPSLPTHRRRSKLFPLRLSPGETASLKKASRLLGESVAAILRKGAALYIKKKGKGGSRLTKEKKP